MKTYQKTFWKNAHGMEVPVALEDWPRKAMFLTVDIDGYMVYWKAKPYYDQILEWFIHDAKNVINDINTKRTGGALHIWERPQ
jgi:hypothetical protein